MKPYFQEPYAPRLLFTHTTLFCIIFCLGLLHLMFCVMASKRHQTWSKCVTCSGLTAYNAVLKTQPYVDLAIQKFGEAKVLILEH